MKCKYWDVCQFRYINATCNDEYQASNYCGAYRRFEEEGVKMRDEIDLTCQICGMKMSIDDIGKVVHPYKDEKGYYIIIRKKGKLVRMEQELVVLCKKCHTTDREKNKYNHFESLAHGWVSL